MGVISWIIFGMIAGYIAKMIHPGKDPGGFVMTVIIGIVGAMVGGLGATMLGLGDVTGFNLTSFLIAVAGSIALLAINRVVNSKS